MDQRTQSGTSNPHAGAQVSGRRRGALSPIDADEHLASLVGQSISDVFGRYLQNAESQQSIRDAIDWALAHRSVGALDLVDTPPMVFQQALDALRYCQLRKELIFLLASSLEKRSFHKVLPAHVEMLKQLTADEFSLLTGLLVSARGTPLGIANVVQPNAQALVIYRNVVSESLAGQMTFKENIPQYVDNLVRLGLLEISAEPAGPDAVYRAFTRLDFLLRIAERAPQRSRLVMVPYSMRLTDLGKNLRDLCTR